MSTTTKSVVRIGGPIAKDKIVLLKHAILSHFKSEESTGESAFTLRNKYFEADIVLQDLKEGKFSETAIEDGVLLVFDALECNPDIANGSSFDELTVHHPEGAGDLLRVCIGVSLGQWSATELRGQKEEDEYSKRILWCLDRGYEYIELDLSKEGQQRGHDERDKDGFARLIEAIQGTVWSSAVMKTKQQQQEEREQLEAEKKKRLVEEEKKKQEEEEGGGTNNEANDKEAPAPTDSTYEPPILLKEPDDEGNTEQEKSLKKLEGLVHEAGRIREMSRSGQMGDDERRQRAADAATLMMGLMGLDGDDDDEEDDSSSMEEN